MKINKISIITSLMLSVSLMSGCNKFLDREPQAPSPESFFTNVEQLDAYVMPRYSAFSVNGGYNAPIGFVNDQYTDNQAGFYGSSIWSKELYKVSATGNWSWETLYNINYFFDKVLPKFENGEISGTKSLVEHSIGEMYFFRAFFYFEMLKNIGDAPIILEALKDDKEELVAHSIRQPRNIVARQILSDLDTAISMLSDSHSGGKNRLSKMVAHLFKSRVALFEASWEKNFAGTAFVPNGEGWPGKSTHPDFSYNANEEIAFFLDAALESSKIVADATPLMENPANYDYTDGAKSGNKYFEMFGTEGLGLNDFDEVLMYKSYDKALDISHNALYYINANGAGNGFTNQMMSSFLMENGLPIYDAASGYQGDREIKDMKAGRDSRCKLFVIDPTEVLNDDPNFIILGVPTLLGSQELSSPTGYSIKKGATPDYTQYNGGYSGTTGSIVFRGVEAYLNYIEAYYLKNGSIAGDADLYWKAIRNRANVDADYTKTINATDMKEEAKYDMAAYTAGQLVDPTMFNIRRERRVELCAEGYRMDDLIRYRAMDQLISRRTWVPQGFKLWDYYCTVTTNSSAFNGENFLYVPYPESGSNVSSKDDFTINGDEVMSGKYIYPHRANDGHQYYDGFVWMAAHYLAPIGADHLLNATEGEPILENSVIYQNPGWGVIVGDSAEEIAGFN